MAIFEPSASEKGGEPSPAETPSTYAIIEYITLQGTGCAARLS